MLRRHFALSASFLIICCAVRVLSQTQAAAGSNVVPPLVKFSGVLTDGNSKPLTGTVGVTFSLYKDEQGGSPLWVETQNVQPDKSGHYSVMLGSTTSQGLPGDLFISGEAHWVGVQAQGQPEQPRVLLPSVPYALKAQDAQTIGGLPPSAFMLAAPSSRASTAVTAGSSPAAGSGTMNYIPIWTDSSGDLGNSVLYQTSAGMVGIGTATPAATLDVSTGDVSIDSGNLDLPLTVLDQSKVGVVTVGGTPFVHTCCSPKNTFVGSNAGTNAGTFSIDGADDTGIGNQALNAIRNGDSNTAVGSLAMQSQTDGGSNTAIGASALELATATSYNTAIGENSLTQTTTGGYNTALGTSTGNGNLTGTNNTFLGMGADTSVSNLTFATAIGSNAIVSESNALVLGGTGANAVKVGIGTAAPAYTLDVQGTGNFTGAVTFASSQSFPNTISGVTTAAGSGLMGGGTSGTLNLSLLNTCSGGQVLSWSGGAWVCTTISGGGTITGVTAGTDLTGGGTSGNVTLNLDTTKVPQLATANTFAATQTVNGLVAITGSGNGVQFPDGTLQTTAATGGGGVPSGFMILGSTSTAPPGYTLSGTMVSGNVASSLAPMPTARSELGVATVAGKIYAIGGYNPIFQGGYLNVNEVYDPSTNSWSTKAPMATRRAYFAAAAAENGKIYAIGGTIGVSILKFVEVYDPVSNTWSTVPALPGAREGLAAAVYLNDIYAIGGFSSQATYLSDLLVFTGSSWGRLKPMPSGRAYLAAATVNGKIYAIGGYDGHSVLDTVEVYDTQHNTWTAAAPMPTARRDLAAVVLNNKIYAIGGSDGQSSLNLVEVYDPSTNTWSTAPSPLAARTQFGAVALNGFIYLMGGAAGPNILGTVEQYSPPQTLYTFTKN
jgi:N-acetylneuraminic acid mutarotase